MTVTPNRRPDPGRTRAAIRAGLLGILVVMLLAAAGRAYAAPGPLAVSALTPHADLQPGETVTLLARVRNEGVEALALGARVDAPQGWRVVVPPPNLTLAPGEAQTVVLTLLAPERAPAGAYAVDVSFSADGVPAARTAFAVDVAAVGDVQIHPVEAPSYAAGPFAVAFAVQNLGNVPVQLEFSADDALGYATRVDPAAAALEPGERRLVNVQVAVAPGLTERVQESVRLNARDPNRSDARAEANAALELVPTRIPLSAAYHTFPVSIQIGAVSEGEAVSPTWSLSGAGRVTETDPGRLSFLLDPETHTAAYRRDGFALTLGDQAFSLSPLTESGVTGSGLAVELGTRPWRGRVIAHAVEGSGTRLGGNVEYAFANAAVALNALSDTTTRSEWFSLKSEWGPPGPLALSAEIGRRLAVDGPGASAWTVASRISGPRAVGSLSVGGAAAGYREGSAARRQAAFSGSLALSPHLRAGFGWSGYREGSGASGATRFASLSGLAGALPWTLSGWSSTDVDAALGRDAASGQVQLFVAAPLGGGRRLDQSLQLKGDRSRLAPATARLSYRAALVTPTAGEFDVSAGWTLAPDPAERGGPSLSAGWRGSLTRRLSAHLFADGAGATDGSGAALDLGGAFSYALGGARRLTFGLEFPHADDWSDVKASIGFAADFELPLGRKANVGHVSGRVVDSAGRGVAGLIVDVDGRSVLTAGDGAFAFPAIPPGEHFLSIQPDSLGPNRVTAPESPLRFTMAPKQRLEYDFTVYAAGSIGGRLTAIAPDQSALGGVVVGMGGAAAAGPSFAGVVVTLRPAGGERVLQQTTDADGRFRFDHLPPGDWQLAVDGRTLPEGYRLDEAVPALHLAEGEAAELNVRVNPIVRAIDFAPGGTLELSVGS